MSSIRALLREKLGIIFSSLSGGRARINRILSHYPSLLLLKELFFEFISFRITRFNKKFAYSRFPEGFIIQPLDNIGINYNIYEEKVYEQFYRLKESDVVIDVGAHVGVFTLKASRKASKVLAVEPHPFNYNLLVNNVKRNALVNVLTVNVGLANYNGIARLYCARDSGSHSISLKCSDTFIEIPVKTLDDLLYECGIDKVSVIKIDAEGAELEILEGACKTLQKNSRLYIAVASYHKPDEVIQASNFLRNLGFRVLVWRGSYVYGFKGFSNDELRIRQNSKLQFSNS